MVGVDYPHHEGTWNGGTQNWFQATLGANEVPEAEARKMLGENAAAVFGFDLEALRPLAERIGPDTGGDPDTAHRGSFPPAATSTSHWAAQTSADLQDLHRQLNVTPLAPPCTATNAAPAAPLGGIPWTTTSGRAGPDEAR